MPTEEPMTPTTEQVFVTTKFHPTVIESHLDTELHIDVKHQLNNAQP